MNGMIYTTTKILYPCLYTELIRIEDKLVDPRRDGRMDGITDEKKLKEELLKYLMKEHEFSKDDAKTVLKEYRNELKLRDKMNLD